MLDWQARGFDWIEQVPAEISSKVVAIVTALLEV
jgi:hypothetical protein